MARYIDAEELCRRINECWETNDIDKGRVIQQVIDRVITPIVVGTPTADVVEVKHGCWKDRYGNKYDNHLYECSVCGEKALYEVDVDELGQSKIRQVLSNGCPNCLAKMDERNETT